MTQITLFHHVLGRTDAVEQLGERLRRLGCDVDVPDLFDGHRFATIPEGLAYVQDTGDAEIMQRAVSACPDEGTPQIYAGCSYGAMIAQQMLQTRPSAGGLLLCSFVDPPQLPGRWPSAPPVHVFGSEDDPFLLDDGDLDAARAWQQTHPNLRIHLYPGSGHLFAEEGFADYDAAAAAALVDDIAAALPTMAS